MPTARPMSRMTELICGSTGMTWLTSAVTPSAPATAVMPSSRGIPAATTAPKASSRISSVTGSDVTSARWKSFPIRSPIARLALASPNSPMKSSEWARWTAAVAASAGYDAILGSGRIAGDLERQQRRGSVLGAHALVAALAAATRSAQSPACGTSAPRGHRQRRGTALPTADRCGSGTAPARRRARWETRRPAPGWRPATRRSPSLTASARPSRPRCRARTRSRQTRAS